MSTVSQPEIGSAYNLVNLRDKNGALVPVSPRKSILTLNEKYDYLFMHQMASFGVHYLGVRDSALYYIYHEATTTPYDLLLCTVGTNLQLSQIGNIVNITSSLGVQQLIWYNNSYVVIDTNFDGLQTDTTIGLCKVDLKVDGTTVNTSGSDKIVSRSYRSSTQFSYGSNAEANTDENRKIRSVVYDGLYSKALAGLRKDGIISGFTMATTAIELYDGSYILHSEPIILGQAWDKFSRYNVTVNNTDYNYLDKKAVFSLSTPYADNFPINSDGYAYNYDPFSGLLAYEPNSVNEIWVSSDIFPNFIGYYDKFENNNNVGNRYLWLYVLEQKLKFKISSVIQESLRPIVKSLSVFLSSEVSIYKTENEKNYSFVANARVYSSGSVYEVTENYLPPVKTNAEIIKELADNQIFYKVHEIPFDDLKTVSDWIEIDLKGKLGDSLINQEQLPIDNFTYHSIVPVKQYVYNSRLHLLNYDQVLGRGFPLNYFESIGGVGQFNNTPILNDRTSYWISVDIKTDSGTSTVVRLKNRGSVNAPDYTYALSSMLSYPDRRAVRMTIHSEYYMVIMGVGAWIGYEKTYDLKASETANFAYYISPDIKPITSEANVIVDFEAKAEVNRSQTFQSGLKVSEVNNPFVFPAKNTYTIGNGRALNMSSNAMRVSEGQFGQYPLYVFTEDGVYALQIGTEVLYITQAPISTVQPISDKILSTPFGIFFITKKGLHIINGQEVALFSVMLEQKRDIITLSKIDYQTAFGAFMINNEELYSYLSSNNLKMVFNPHENEILLNKGTDKIFCANVEAPNWYLSTENWDFAIENALPDLFVSKVKIKTVVDTPATEEQIIMTDPGSPEQTVVDVPGHWDTPAPIIGTLIEGGSLIYVLQEGDSFTWNGTYYEFTTAYRIGIIKGEDQPAALWSVANQYSQEVMVIPNMAIFEKMLQGEYSYPVPYWTSDSPNGTPVAYVPPSTFSDFTTGESYNYFGVNLIVLDGVWIPTTYRTIPAVPPTYETIPTTEATYKDIEVCNIFDYEQAATEVVNSVEREVRTQCAFSLRGFDLGTDGYKKFRRAWIRGQIIKGTNLFAMLHGSIDNRTFDAIKGINITKKNTSTAIEADYKDIDLGLVGVNYKQFSLSLGMTCDSSTKIDGIEIEVEKEYDNEKL